jgi:hypothetical protein
MIHFRRSVLVAAILVLRSIRNSAISVLVAAKSALEASEGLRAGNAIEVGIEVG